MALYGLVILHHQLLNIVYKEANMINEQIVKKLRLNKTMQNTCKVELFDALTGKKKEQVQVQNTISNYLERWIAQQLFLSYMLSDRETTIETASGQLYTPFGHIVLSSFAGPADADMKHFMGDMLGWARRAVPYSGPSTYMGNRNYALSTQDTDLKSTLIYDWPTQAANGDIKSVFWHVGDGIGTDNLSLPAKFGAVTVLANDVTGWAATGKYGPCAIKDEWLYYTVDAYIYRVKVGPFANPSRALATREIVADLTAVDATIRGIQWDGTYWWIFGDTTDKFYKYDTDWNQVTNFSFAIDTYCNSTYRPWILHDSKLHMVKYTSATDYKLHRVSLSGTVELSTQMYTTSGNFYTNGIKDASMRLIADGDGLLYVFNGQTNTSWGDFGYGAMTFLASDHSKQGDFGFASEAVLNNAVWNPSLKIFENPQARHFWNLYPCAHAILPATISKTSSDFLRVSYTFELDSAVIP